MKRTYSIFLGVLSCLILFNTIGCINVSATGLQVTFTSNPTIAAPGTYGYLEVNLRSTASTVNSISIIARSSDISAVIAQGNWDVSVGSLAGGQSHSVLYKFHVPSTASPGLYPVVFDITGGGGSIRQTAIIKVEDTTVLNILSVSPTSISIGEATTLIFTIENHGGVQIDNILFTWVDSNNLILPIGTDNRIRIPSIAARNYTDVPVVVMASSGLAPGVYPLTIMMDYYDNTGTKQTIVSTVGLQVSGTTTFDVILQTSTATSTTFAVVNTGANTASSVVVSIPQQAGYTTSGSSSASVGNLNAGDYTLSSFQITSTSSGNTTTQFPSFNRTGTGSVPPNMNLSDDRREMTMNRSFAGMSGNQLLVQIAYTDIFGVRQTIQKQVNLSGSANGLASRTTTLGTSGAFPGGFSGQSQSTNDSTTSIVYVGIGVAGIIIIVAIIQLGRKRKLSRLSNLFKGRNE